RHDLDRRRNGAVSRAWPPRVPRRRRLEVDHGNREGRRREVAMPPIRSDQPLVPSVLDRLLDDDPAVTTEPARNRSQMLRELKLSVRRDIESLLNARRRNVVIP